jgi:hypothetical protein
MGRVTGAVVKNMSVEFFCYHRDRPGSVTLRGELVEEHLSYMDRYQAELIARGPTMSDDGETPTGIWCSASAQGRPPTWPPRWTGTT